MAVVTWEEIHQLRSNLRNIQSMERKNRLVERNCVELINLLVKKGFLNVIFTTDGKEIITKERLLKEILGEIYNDGGRLNIVDLAQRLKVDLGYIEKKVGEICKEDPTLHFIQGEFISTKYTNDLIEKINEFLNEHGRITIKELIERFNLSTNYVNSILKAQLAHARSNRIKYQSGAFYTKDYIYRQQSMIIGCLEGALLPVRFGDIIKRMPIDENLIFSLVDDLIRCHKIHGNLVGTNQKNTIFNPKVYMDAQFLCITSFFKQDHYIEYARLRNIGFVDPKGQIKLVLKDGINLGKPLFLSSGCVDLYKFVPELETDIELKLSTNDYVDMKTLMPRNFTTNDIERLIAAENSITDKIERLGGRLISNMFVVSKRLIWRIDIQLGLLCQFCIAQNMMRCTPEMYATAVLEGRDRKLLACINKQRPSFVTYDDFKRQLQLNNTLLPKKLIEELAKTYYDIKENEFHNLFVRAIKDSSSPGASVGYNMNPASNNNANHAQQLLVKSYNHARIFASSILRFQNENEIQLCELLNRHLIQTLCSGMCGILVCITDNRPCRALSEEERTRIIRKMSEPNQTELLKLNQALNSTNVETVLIQMEETVAEVIKLHLKQPRKRDKRDTIVEIREELKSKLSMEWSPEKVLNLTVMLLCYATRHGLLICTPPNAVPLLIRYLKNYLPNDISDRLAEAQEQINQSTTFSVDTIKYLKEIGLNIKEQTDFT